MPPRSPTTALPARSRTRGRGSSLAAPRLAPRLRASAATDAWLPVGWFRPFLAALLLRLLWVAPAWNSTFVGDESGYLHLATGWAQTGAYEGQWPPLQALFLRPFVEAFPRDEAVLLARLVTTLLSVWTGAWLMIAGKALAGDRAGRLSGWTWAFYLPLIPFAHILVSEGLFMAWLIPAIAVLLRGGSRGPSAFLIPGALLGLACLTREAGLIWLLALGAWTWRRSGLRGAALLVSAASLVIASWAIPASIQAGALMAPGRTAGVNAYLGWNAHYVNFDLTHVDVPTSGTPGAALRASLLEVPGGTTPWKYDYSGTLLERDRRALRDGAAFLMEEPTYIARTRLVKAADVFTPLSELTRCLQLKPASASALEKERAKATSSAWKNPLSGYGAPITGTAPRVTLAAFATLSTILLFLLAIPGAWLFANRTRSGSFMTSLMAAAWFATSATSLVVAMSRLRAPFEALLILPAAITLAALHDRARPQASLARWSGAALALLSLAFLWYLSVPAVVGTFGRLMCLPT